MDQIINLKDFRAPTLEARLAMARREYPGMNIMYVGRPSVLGNPYELFGRDQNDKVKREDSIRRYRKWLWGQIQAANPEVIEALNAINENTILACWCYPLQCHSNAIWNAWHYLKSKERVRSQEPALCI